MIIIANTFIARNKYSHLDYFYIIRKIVSAVLEKDWKQNVIGF